MGLAAAAHLIGRGIPVKVSSSSNLTMLVKQGHLKIEDESAIEILVSTIGLISRFWISEAAISFRHWNTDQQIRHYLILIVKLLSPYATTKGNRDLEMFTMQLHADK